LAKTPITLLKIWIFNLADRSPTPIVGLSFSSIITSQGWFVMSLTVAEIYVVSGNLVSATSSVADQAVVEDILNSNLLCQMATDKSLTSRFLDPASWLASYRNSLGKMYWQITSSNNDSYSVPALERSVTIMKIFEDTFFKTLDQELRSSVQESAGLWTDLSKTSAPSLLFNAKTNIKLTPGQSLLSAPKAVSVINLQVSVIYGGSRVASCCVYFKTSESVESDVFNQQFAVKNLSGNITVSSLKANFLGANYADIRQLIITKLGEQNILDNILLLPTNIIPPHAQTNTDTRQFIASLEI
jgi:hypothetical protein